MERNVRGLVVLLVIALFSQCKKKGPGEGIFLPSETLPVRIVLPDFGEAKRLTLAFSTETDSGTALLIKRLVAASLSRDRRVFTWDPEGLLSHEKTAYQLTVRVNRQEGKLRLEARLTDPSGKTLATQYYEEPETQAFVLAEEMTARTLSALLLEEREEKRASSTLSGDIVSPLAQAYLLLERKNKTATQEAIGFFQEVLSEDSTAMPALLGLSEAYLRLIEAGWERHRVFIQLAQNAAQKAIQTDPSDPQAYFLLGRCLLAWGDTRQAETVFRQALALNPNQTEAWAALGRIYGHLGLYEPALTCDNRALSLQPGCPEILFHRAVVWMGLQRYKEAERGLEAVVHLKPDYREAWLFLALVRSYRGRFQPAREALAKAGDEGPRAQAFLALIEARSGRRDEALGRLELELVPWVGHDASLALAAASIYAVLGRNGQAVSWFEKALDFGYRDYPWALHDPNFDGLRQDERFIRLMAHLKRHWEEEVRRHIGDPV